MQAHAFAAVVTDIGTAKDEPPGHAVAAAAAAVGVWVGVEPSLPVIGETASLDDASVCVFDEPELAVLNCTEVPPVQPILSFNTLLPIDVPLRMLRLSFGIPNLLLTYHLLNIEVRAKKIHALPQY